MEGQPEVKVPVRLSTRDPSIQLAQDAGPLLVQTCECWSHGCQCMLLTAEPSS